MQLKLICKVKIINPGVPHLVFINSFFLTISDSPKSAIFIFIFFDSFQANKILSNFRSLWTTFFFFKYANAFTNYLNIIQASYSVKCPIHFSFSQRSPPFNSSVIRITQSTSSKISKISSIFVWPFINYRISSSFLMIASINLQNHLKE